MKQFVKLVETVCENSFPVFSTLHVCVHEYIYCTVLHSSLACSPQKCDNELPHYIEDVSAVAWTAQLSTDQTLLNMNSILSVYWFNIPIHF